MTEASDMMGSSKCVLGGLQPSPLLNESDRCIVSMFSSHLFVSDRSYHTKAGLYSNTVSLALFVFVSNPSVTHAPLGLNSNFILALISLALLPNFHESIIDL